MEKKKKMQWETPVLVDLDRRKAHGLCENGSANHNCQDGAAPGLYCTIGSKNA